jgi:3-dehydroquinate dehydratase/shikimate dehydrogenase
MIIVSITGPSMPAALSQMAASRRYADMFELRLDLIERPKIDQLIAHSRRPIIATCRSVRQGGAFGGSKVLRSRTLEEAANLGAQYIDIEYDANSLVIKRHNDSSGPKVILSRHYVDSAPRDVRRLFWRMLETGADILKLAYYAHDAADIRYAIEFLRLAAREKRKAVAIAMGVAGEATRILYRKFGGWATFAAPESGKAAAQGQLTARTLRLLYRAHALSRSTKIFGVIGNPLGQSRGIFVHNPLFKTSQVDAVYCRFQVKDLSAFMRYVSSHLAGFSVTIPHKRAVMRFLDVIDKSSLAIGAVNTVVRRHEKLYGTNTDASGALDAIEEVTVICGKRMLVLGAGGAARAIAFAAKERGAEVYVANRTGRKAKRLASELGLRAVPLEEVQKVQYDVVVNATSVGMVPNPMNSLVPKNVLRGKIVFDAVYNPPLTRLLQDAKSVGATVIPGTRMYANQAALQFKLYTRTKVRKERIRRLVEKVGD